MKPNQVALCGVTLSLAVALVLVVRRSRAAQQRGSVATVFHKDEQLEAARIASDQEFADGSLVKVKDHGTARVLNYIPPSKSYKIEIVADGKTQQKTVAAIHISHIKVKELYVYPIKSCRGIRLDHSAVITARGIANDRMWMIVDQTGRFATLRRYHKMALISPQLDDTENPTVLTLTAPGMEDLRVPVVHDGEEIPTDVWGAKTVGIHQGHAAAKWINKFLDDVREDREFLLIRKKASAIRATNPKYAPGYETGFADAYPFLLAVDASVTEVNEKLQEKITIDRFRPNIIVTGAPGFADEHWQSLTIGGLRFRNVKPCDRCKVPTVDPQTGIAHPDREPQTTMTPFRNGVTLGFKNGSKHEYYFGSNLVGEDTGRLAVGAPVKVLTTKETVFA